MRDKDSMEYIDARDGFLDLYSSVIKYKNKKKIKIDEYHYINEAIEFARKALHLLEAATKCEYISDQRDMIQQRLDDLLQMRKYFNQDRVIYKPAKKMGKRKKDKKPIGLKRFCQMREYFIGKCYARAIMIEDEDMISMSQYADLSASVELGKVVLEEMDGMKELSKDEECLEDKLRLIKAFNAVREIRKSFFEGPKQVFLDDEWFNQK